MRGASPTSCPAVLVGLALALAAVPRAGAAGEPGRAARAKAREVSFAPLFDTNTRFRPKKTVKLRFRAQYRVPAAPPLAVEDVSFVLRHGPRDAETRVVGVADGLIEEQPEADAELKQRKRFGWRSTR